MLELPDNGDVLRILGIDPGTQTLGTAVLDLDLKTYDIRIVHCETYKADHLAKFDPRFQDISQAHGDLAMRLIAHKENLRSLMEHMVIDELVAESSFMHMRAHAFEALVRCMESIRLAAWEYDMSMPVHKVTPQGAKAAVGAAGKGKGKDAVKVGIKKLLKDNSKQLYYEAPKDFEQLDEHSIDAIAIGYHHAVAWCNFLKGGDTICSRS
tara:strand:- start:58342 stop:58971 length:630 start_codon:yes stop_codon:yes gene_type:complete